MNLLDYSELVNAESLERELQRIVRQPLGTSLPLNWPMQCNGRRIASEHEVTTWSALDVGLLSLQHQPLTSYSGI